jgi:hypothetical protein
MPRKMRRQLAACVLACCVIACPTSGLDLSVRLFDTASGRPNGNTHMLRGVAPSSGAPTEAGLQKFCNGLGHSAFDDCAGALGRLLAETERQEGGDGRLQAVEALLPESEQFVGAMFKAPPGAKKAERRRLQDAGGDGLAAARAGNRKKKKQARKDETQRERIKKKCSESFENDTGSEMRCLINEGQLSAAVVVIDAFLADFSSRFSPNWTLAVQNAPGQLTQTVVLSTFALGLLQEWLDPSEEGQTIAAGNFREFSRKAGLMHRYNTQLEKLLVYAWVRAVGQLVVPVCPLFTGLWQPIFPYVAAARPATG